MTYNLFFLELALKEWKKLDSSIQQQFKKKIESVLKSSYFKK